MPLKIIICGGGIGGLSAAGYLRAKHDVTVLERGALDFAADDYGLSVVANSFNLLQKAGIKSENLDMVIMTHVVCNISWHFSPSDLPIPGLKASYSSSYRSYPEVITCKTGFDPSKLLREVITNPRCFSG